MIAIYEYSGYGRDALTSPHLNKIQVCEKEIVINDIKKKVHQRATSFEAGELFVESSSGQPSNEVEGWTVVSRLA